MSAYLKEIEALHPAVRQMHEEVYQERMKKLEARRELAEKLKANGLMAIARLAEALRDPMNPGADLREAKFYFDEALMAAFRMEPEDFDEDNLQNGRVR